MASKRKLSELGASQPELSEHAGDDAAQLSAAPFLTSNHRPTALLAAATTWLDWKDTGKSLMVARVDHMLAQQAKAAVNLGLTIMILGPPD